MKPFFKPIFVLSIIIFFNISSCLAQKNVKFNLIDNQIMIEILNKQKVNFEQVDLAYIKDLKSFINFNNKKLIIPDYFIYNNEGHLINQGLNKDECGSLIRTLHEHLFKIDKNETFESFLENVDFVGKNQDFKNQDFIVFITWASFADKNSNKESFSNYYYIKKNYAGNVKVFLLNLDINESWSLTKEQKEILKL